jgi:hypothetical protein
MIDRIGRFRGRPTSGVIKTTKNGFPQFTVNILATEYFDDSTGEWVDWSEYDQSITAFLVMFNATKALLNYEQVMKAFNWDGTDLAALQTDDFGDLQVSFEVEENEYQGKVSLRVNWIDTYDSEPRGGNLKSMDAKDLKSLNAQYSQFMVQKKAAAPAQTKAKRKTKAKPTATAPTTPPPTAPPAVPTAPATGLTQDTAWVAVNEASDAGTDAITKAWLQSVAEIAEASDIVSDNFTSNEWEAVRATALDILTV